MVVKFFWKSVVLYHERGAAETIIFVGGCPDPFFFDTLAYYKIACIAMGLPLAQFLPT